MSPKVQKTIKRNISLPGFLFTFPHTLCIMGKEMHRKMNQKVALRASVAEGLECEEEECPLHPEKRIPFWRTPAI